MANRKDVSLPEPSKAAVKREMDKASLATGVEKDAPRSGPDPGVILYPVPVVTQTQAIAAEKALQPVLARNAVAGLVSMNPNYAP